MPARVADVAALDQNPDGSLIAAGSVDGRVYIFDRDGKELHRSEPVAQGPIFTVRWNPAGTTFLAGSRVSQQLQCYDTQAKKSGNPITLMVPGVRSLDWSRDGRYIAMGGDQQIPVLIDLETSNSVRLGRQRHGITNVRFLADDQEVCSVGFDGCIRIWSRDGKSVGTIEVLSAPIRGLALTHDQNRIATGHEDNSVRIWSLTGDEVNYLAGHGGYVQALDFTLDDTQLASGSWDQTVRTWNKDGTSVSTLRGHEGAVFAVQWTRDGKQLLSGAADGTLRLSNARIGECRVGRAVRRWAGDCHARCPRQCETR